MDGNYKNDIEILKEKMPLLPTFWDGRECVLELKEANYNWRQMEWWSFYFEYKSRELLRDDFAFPGDRFGNVSFDLRGAINWDLKSSAIKSDSHKIILNDREAMDLSLAKDGLHGEIIGLCDVEYNDHDRSFQRWHTELKGGLSAYELERQTRTAVSRYRKTKATLTEVLIIVFRGDDFEKLDIMRQGRNSNGRPRREKYMLNLENIDDFENYIIRL